MSSEDEVAGIPVVRDENLPAGVEAIIRSDVDARAILATGNYSADELRKIADYIDHFARMRCGMCGVLVGDPAPGCYARDWHPEPTPDHVETIEVETSTDQIRGGYPSTDQIRGGYPSTDQIRGGYPSTPPHGAGYPEFRGGE